MDQRGTGDGRVLTRKGNRVGNPCEIAVADIKGVSEGEGHGAVQTSGSSRKTDRIGSGVPELVVKLPKMEPT